MRDPSIATVVATFRNLSQKERLRELQRLIGSSTDDRDTLSWRAHLCTALRDEELYPVDAGRLD